MATFTTEQATNYLRERLNDPKNPTPFIIIEMAHKRENYSEIMTRLQGHFGFHDHGPSLRIIARDAVCNLMLERQRAEQIENFKGWERRRVAACKRINAGLYGYCDPQAEDDGISLAAIDTEMGQLANEYNLSLEEIAAIECEVTPEDRRNQRARVKPEVATLNIIQPKAETPRDFLMRVKVEVTISATCEECETKIKASINKHSTERGFVEMLISQGWRTCERGFICGSCSAPKPKPLAIVTCQKCGQDTTGPLIAVDKDDFDVRIFEGGEWIADPAKKVARLICGKCCRG